MEWHDEMTCENERNEIYSLLPTHSKNEKKKWDNRRTINTIKLIYCLYLVASYSCNPLVLPSLFQMQRQILKYMFHSTNTKLHARSARFERSFESEVSLNIVFKCLTPETWMVTLCTSKGIKSWIIQFISINTEAHFRDKMFFFILLY